MNASRAFLLPCLLICNPLYSLEKTHFNTFGLSFAKYWIHGKINTNALSFLVDRKVVRLGLDSLKFPVSMSLGAFILKAPVQIEPTDSTTLCSEQTMGDHGTQSRGALANRRSTVDCRVSRAARGTEYSSGGFLFFVCKSFVLADRAAG